MKAWFAKIRISAALDGDRRPATWRQKETRGPDELGDFEREMAALDGALKQTAPRPQAPASLHSSIMRAIEAAGRPAAKARPGLAFLRWLPLPIAAALALMMFLHGARGPARLPVQSAQSLAGASAALEVGDQMARAVPLAVVTPLANELQNLNRDLDNTAQFLLSSLP